MILLKKNGLTWLEFEQLQGEKGIVHGVFLRPCDLTKEGSKEKIAETLTIPKIVKSHLVHGDQIQCIPQESIGKCDGLATDQENLGLLVTHADCQATLFYDPIQKAIANVHCGWRGSVQNIYGKTVEKMKRSFGTNPENLLVCISPSLGPQAAEFIHYREELPNSFAPFQIKPTYFDFWEIARSQLEEARVLPHHIEIAEQCTFSDEKIFFSYRRDKKTGRHGTVISISQS